MKQILIGRMADASTKDEFASRSIAKNARRFGAAPLFRFQKRVFPPPPKGNESFTTHFMKRKSGVLWKKPQGKAKKFSIFAPSAGALYATNAF